MVGYLAGVDPRRPTTGLVQGVGRAGERLVVDREVDGVDVEAGVGALDNEPAGRGRYRPIESAAVSESLEAAVLTATRGGGHSLIGENAVTDQWDGQRDQRGRQCVSTRRGPRASSPEVHGTTPINWVNSPDRVRSTLHPTSRQTQN